MLQLVTGEYGLGQPVALMVGILNMRLDSCTPPLDGWFHGTAAKNLAIPGDCRRRPCP